MPVYQMRNIKCFCVSGKCHLAKSCFVKHKIGNFVFMEIIFLVTLYFYTIQHLKQTNLNFYFLSQFPAVPVLYTTSKEISDLIAALCSCFRGSVKRERNISFGSAFHFSYGLYISDPESKGSSWTSGTCFFSDCFSTICGYVILKINCLAVLGICASLHTFSTHIQTPNN